MASRSIVSLAIFFVCTLLGNFFFKQGALAIGPVALTIESFKAAASSASIWAGTALYAVSAVAWLASLSTVPLNIAISVSAFIYVGVVLMAALAFHESIPMLRWAGIALVAAGMLVIARTA